jgi:hypothetical protein
VANGEDGLLVDDLQFRFKDGSFYEDVLRSQRAARLDASLGMFLLLPRAYALG